MKDYMIVIGFVVLLAGNSSLCAVMHAQPHAAAVHYRCDNTAALPESAPLSLSAGRCRYKRAQCITSLTEMGFLMIMRSLRQQQPRPRAASPLRQPPCSWKAGQRAPAPRLPA
jgi:hypothetical protein